MTAAHDAAPASECPDEQALRIWDDVQCDFDGQALNEAGMKEFARRLRAEWEKSRPWLYAAVAERTTAAPASDTPRAVAIVAAYLAKCDRVNPDGSTSEDIERDLIEPICAMERELAALRKAFEEPTAWRQVIGSKWAYYDGSQDPREIHDSGKPCEPLYRAPKEPK